MKADLCIEAAQHFNPRRSLSVLVCQVAAGSMKPYASTMSVYSKLTMEAMPKAGNGEHQEQAGRALAHLDPPSQRVGERLHHACEHPQMNDGSTMAAQAVSQFLEKAIWHNANLNSSPCIQLGCQIKGNPLSVVASIPGMTQIQRMT